MQWLLVGHGALSSLWAHHLAEAGAAVTLITRNANGLSELTLSLQTLTGQSIQRTFALTDWQSLSSAQLKTSTILIMAKAWQLDDVLKRIESYPDSPQAIIISHNGLGAGESIISRHSEWPVYDLVTTHGAYRLNPQNTVHAGSGHSVIGRRQTVMTSSPCLNIPEWFNQLQLALPPLEWEPDILLRRWQKLAINCAINPLASLSGQPNGVLQNAHYKPAIQQICSEVCDVAERVLGKGILKPDYLEQQVHQVIKATAANRCSMLQDISAGRNTEIDYLNGYIARLGHHLDIPVPLNDYLYDAIRRLSAQDLSSTNSTTSRPNPDSAE